MLPYIRLGHRIHEVITYKLKKKIIYMDIITMIAKRRRKAPLLPATAFSTPRHVQPQIGGHSTKQEKGLPPRAQGAISVLNKDRIFGQP